MDWISILPEKEFPLWGANRQIINHAHIIHISDVVRLMHWRLATFTVTSSRNICLLFFFLHIQPSWSNLLSHFESTHHHNLAAPLTNCHICYIMRSNKLISLLKVKQEHLGKTHSHARTVKATVCGIFWQAKSFLYDRHPTEAGSFDWSDNGSIRSLEGFFALSKLEQYPKKEKSGKGKKTELPSNGDNFALIDGCTVWIRFE